MTQEKTFEAKVEILNDVLSFMDEKLEAGDCPMKVQTQLDIALEEMFVNVASYAYGDGRGNVVVKLEDTTEKPGIIVTLSDSGKPFDPLAKPDPDVTAGVEERQIGGLGIYMVKKSMDEVKYKYEDGKNIFSMKKFF